MRVIDQAHEPPREAVEIDAPEYVRLKGQNCKSIHPTGHCERVASAERTTTIVPQSPHGSTLFTVTRLLGLLNLLDDDFIELTQAFIGIDLVESGAVMGDFTVSTNHHPQGQLGSHAARIAELAD